MTLDNWLISNLNERKINPLIDFKMIFNPIKFKMLSFDVAMIDVIEKISNINNKIFVSFSGGLDSEYILRQFNKYVHITPIIVSVSGTINNKQEAGRAYNVCKELQITPIIIECTDQEYVRTFITDILNTHRGVGINITPVVFAKKYAQKHNGILLTGEHCIDDDPLITKGSICEWDLYFEHENIYGPLIYTPEIFYAIVQQFDGTPVQQFKSRLFKLDYRDKMKIQIKTSTLNIIDKIISLMTCHTVKRIHQLGNKHNILEFMNGWNT